MPYKAVIFDLDGTLVDSLEDLAGAGNRTLAAMGFAEHPLSAYRTFVGDGLLTLVTRMLPEKQRREEVITDAAARFREDYRGHWQVRTALYSGIAEMLTILGDCSIPMSILSNKPDEFTRLVVQRYLQRWRFRPVFGQRQDVPRKPDPTAALEIAAMLALRPSQILFVGDSAVDMQTARHAGMDAVGVLWGFRTVEELQKNGARYTISHPVELPDILKAG